MTTIAITPQLKVTMLKHLVAGHDLDFVATATRVPRDTVLDIVSAHGYPKINQMKWSIDILIKTGGKIPESHLRTGTPLDPVDPAARVGNSATGVNDSSGFAVVAAAPVLATSHPTHTGELLSRAAQSPFMRTQNLGAKISALLTDLTARLDDEQEAREAKVKADKEHAAVAARIAQLEAEIAKLKRKTPKVAKATAPKAGVSDSAAIRAWAKANNVACSNTGAVRQVVRTAYEAANAA
jgi:hypothetical protein